jgi:hypothetical protein
MRTMIETREKPCSAESVLELGWAFLNIITILKNEVDA